MKKKIIIVFAVLLSVVLIFSLVLEYAINLNSYKGQITELAENALHRKVEVGNIAHTLWRGPGAAVQDIKIFERDQSNFFVQAKDIIAKVKILPLLSKRIEVSKVVLDQPVIVVKRDRAGVWNFEDLLGERAKPTPSPVPKETLPAPPATPPQDTPTPEAPEESPKPPKKASPFSQFAIELFRLNDGVVRFVDEMVNVTTEVGRINADFEGITTDTPIHFQLSADVNGGKQGNIKASGQIGPIPADGNIDNLALNVTAQLDQIDLVHFSPYYQQSSATGQSTTAEGEKLNATIQLAGNIGTQLASTGSVSVGEVTVDVTGNVQEMKKTPQLDLTISSQELSWEKLFQILPPDLAKQMKDLGLSGMGSFKIQPKGPLDHLTISGECDLSQSGMRYQNLFAKPEALPTVLTFEAVLKPDAVTLSALTLSVGDFVLTISGTITNFKAPVLDLQLSSNEFPLDKLLPLFPELSGVKGSDSPGKTVTAGGTGVLSALAKGPIDDLALELVVDFDKSEITHPDFLAKPLQSVANFRVQAHLGKDSLAIEKMLFQLGDFQLTTTGKVVNFKQPQLDLALNTNVFDINTFLSSVPIARTSLPPELTLGGGGKVHITTTGPPDNLTISGVVDLNKGEITFDGYFSKPKEIPGIMTFDATVKKDTVEIHRVQINVNDVLLDITGLISNLQQEAQLELSVRSNKFALNQLLSVPGMPLNPTGTTELNVVIRTPLAKIDPASLLTGTVRLNQVGFTLPQVKKPVKNLNARIEIQGEEVVLQKFSVVVGESSVEGNAQVKSAFTTPNITFALYAPYLNLDEFMQNTTKTGALLKMKENVRSEVYPLLIPLPASSSPGFQLVAATQSQPTSKSSSGLNPFLTQLIVNGTVKVDRGQAKKVKFADLSADVKMEKGVLNVDNLLFALYDGNYQGYVKLDLNTPDPKYEFQSKLVQVNTNQMLTDSTTLTDVLYGLLFADASIQGQGFETEQLVKTLSGKGKFKVEDGKFTTFEVWSELASIFQLLGTVGKSKELARIGTDLSQFANETRFARFEGSFDLKNGNAGSSDMILEVPAQDMHIALLLNGTFGLDTALDFIGRVRFDPQSKYYNDVEKHFRDFKQPDGSIELPFPIPIGGTLLKPAINMQSVEKNALKVAGEIAKQAVKSQVEKQVLELLLDKSSKGILTPTPAPEAQQTPTAQEPTPTPTPQEVPLEKVGEELLKGIFKKKKK